MKKFITIGRGVVTALCVLLFSGTWAQAQTPFCAGTNFYGQPSTDGARIDAITLGTFSNVTGPSASLTFQNFTSPSIPVCVGQSYSVSLNTSSSCCGTAAAVWVDWNGNQTWETTENVFNASKTGPFSPDPPGPAGQIYSFTLTVPNGTTPGVKRVRIRVGESTMAASDACTFQNTWGEVEDYTLSVSSVANPASAGSNSPVCVGSALNLTVATVAGATYSWTGPSSFTSATQNPTIASPQTQNGGVYSVVAIANACTSAVVTTTVVVRTVPTATISGTPAAICQGQTANFNVALTGTQPWTINVSENGGAPTAISGITTSPYTLTVTPSVGTRTFTLTSVADANGCTGGAVSGAPTVVVRALPTATSSTPTATVCLGQTVSIPVTLTGASPWTVQYTANAGPGPVTQTVSGITASPFTLVVTPSSAGTISYNLTQVTDANCTKAVSGLTVVTVKQPPAAFMGGSPPPICQGETAIIAIFLQGTAPWSFKYKENNGTPVSVTGITGAGFALVTLTVTPMATGNVTYTLTEVTDAGGCTNGSLTGTAVVNVKPRPTATIAGNHPAICEGQGAVMALLFTGTPPWNIEYRENGGAIKTAGPFSNTLELLAVTPTNTGTVSYTLNKVTDALGCPTGVVSGTGTVPVKPKAKGTMTSTQGDICLGQSGSFKVDLIGTAPWSIKFQINTNAPITVNNITATPFIFTFTPGTPGMKTYTLLDVTDSGNCPGGMASGSFTFNVKQGPSAMIGGQNTTICEGNPVTFAVQLTGTAPWTFKYKINGSPDITVANVTNPLNTITVTPSATGMLTYTLSEVTDASGCTGLVSGSFMVNVLAKPTAMISGASTGVCEGFSTSFRLDLTGAGPWNIEYSENGGAPIAFNGIASTPFNLTVTPSSVGNRTFTVTKVMDMNGCPGGMTSGMGTVTVNDAPTATISGSPMICNGQAAMFQVDLTGVAPWAITVSENSNPPMTISGITATPYMLMMTPPGPGTFNYILVDVFDASACLGGETFGSVTAVVGSINPASAMLSGNAPQTCLGQAASFTVNLTGGAPWSVSYSENGGTPMTVNNITASPYTLMVTPTGTGMRTYTLTSMTQNAPCSQTSVSGMGTVDVVSTDQASATISGTSAPICVGQMAIFPITFTGVGPWTISYRENAGTPFFVSGITANPYTLTVTPSALGLRTYTLNSVTGTSPCGNAGVAGSVTVQVNANILPTAALSSGATLPICLGQSIPLIVSLTGEGPWTVQYRENGGAPVTVSGITASPAIINVTPSAVGVRVFTLNSVTDAKACGQGTTSGGVQITVNANSNAQATILGSATSCGNQPVALTVNLSGTAPFSISYVENGSNPMTVNNIQTSPYSLTVTPTSAGVRTFTLINVSDGVGCSSGTVGGSATVTVIQGPTVSLSAGPQSICIGQTATFTLTLTGVAPWTVIYSRNGTPVTLSGIAASPFTVTTTPATTGLITYSLISATDGSQGCNQATVSGLAVIEVSSGITLSLVSKTDLGCNTLGSFQVNAGAGATYSIDGQNFNNTSGIFSNLLAGNYVVTAKKGGCTTTLLVTIVQPTAPTGLNVSQITSLSALASWNAVSGAASYSVGYRVVGATQYQFVTSQTISRTLSDLQPGTNYEVVVRVTCPNGTTSELSTVVTFTTQQAPQTGCATPTNVLAQVTGPNSATLMWNTVSQASCYIVAYGPLNTNPANWPQFLIPHPGNMLQVSGLSANTAYGVTVRTNCTTCSVRSGVRSNVSAITNFTTSATREATVENPVQNASEISVYPNPNRGLFTVNFDFASETTQNVVLRVTDVTGRVVHRREDKAVGGENVYNMDLQGVSPGIYFLQLETKSVKRTLKVIVQ